MGEDDDDDVQQENPRNNNGEEHVEIDDILNDPGNSNLLRTYRPQTDEEGDSQAAEEAGEIENARSLERTEGRERIEKGG